MSEADEEQRPLAEKSRPPTKPARVGNPKSPVHLRAEELLADGEWHSYEQLMSRLIRLIPPGQAARRAEVMRQSSGGRARGISKASRGKRARPQDLHMVIRTGARALVKDVLRKAHVFEVAPTGKLQNPAERRIRLVPRVEEPLTHEDFTEGQLMVLRLAGEGFDSLTISRKMGGRANNLRDNSARSYYTQVMKKLDANSVALAVFRARQWGVLPPVGPLEGVDLQLARALLEYRANNGVYLADKIDVPVDVMDRARRRLYCRFGVNTMPLLRARLRQALEPADPEPARVDGRNLTRQERAQLGQRAVDLYVTQGIGGVRTVAQALGVSYGLAYELLSEAGAVHRSDKDSSLEE